MINNQRQFTGDFTFSDGKSFAFTNESEFNELFYRIIDTELSNYTFSIHKIPTQICTEFMIDNIDYELLIPGTIVFTGTFKNSSPITKTIDKFIHYNKETHKKYYEDELNKIKELFFKGKSNIEVTKLIDNIFENAELILLNGKVETIFTDEIAEKICRKIQTPYIRSLLEKSSLNRIKIHMIAMNCYKKYGGHMITFLLRLKKLKFGNRNVTTVRTYEKNTEGLIPAYRIRLGNKSCIIRFYEKKIGEPINQKAAILLDPDKKIQIGLLTRNGNIVKRNSDNISIRLFMDKFNCDELYSEVELGNCLNPKCNKPLTDQRSLIAGYGKCCAQNLGIPY